MSVAEEQEASMPDGDDPARPGSREAFVASLEQRARAARGLEQDLLTDVPLLYGSAEISEPMLYRSPGSVPVTDPGILLDRLHREDMIRRNGGGMPPSSNEGSDVSLPFERGLAALFFLLYFFFLFARHR